jgi:UDP:flavonoid glycosyltransferase YjiC (YdhE family)
VALACGLRDRGYRVTILCDKPTEQLISSTDLPTITIPPEVDQTAYLTHGFIIRWAEENQSAGGQQGVDASNPLIDWATAAFPLVKEAVSGINPDLIVGSLFCMGLADQLAQSAGIPWCFVNPGFYFGDHSTRRLDEDYYGSSIQSFVKGCLLPLARRAHMVLHATDHEFDFKPSQLPTNHHYVGFLLWEAAGGLPEYVNHPGDPWALVTLSTAPQRGELTLALSALQALADQPVRTLLTLPSENYAEELGDVPGNVTLAGYVPHTPVLENSSIVICHAGHGLVSKTLYHGVPMVLLPWDRDQPGVAARAERLGIARVVARPQVSADTVSQAVDAVLNESDYVKAAIRVSTRLKRTNAIDVACSLIERM